MKNIKRCYKDKEVNRFLAITRGMVILAILLAQTIFAQSISIPSTYTTINKSDTVFNITTTNTDSWYKFTSTNSVAEVDIFNSTSPGFDSASIWVESGSVITYIQSGVRITDENIILATGLSSANIYWVDFHKTGASSVSAIIHSQFRSTTAPVSCGAGCPSILYDSTNTCQLVCNGEFNYHYFTPVNPNLLVFACPWLRPVSTPATFITTPDYFCTDNASTATVHVPNNFCGWQQSYTHNSTTGYEGYAGVVTYWGGDSNYPADPDYREYLQAPLNSTLLNNHQYKVSFRISKADKAKNQSKNIGAWVTASAPTQIGGNYITGASPQAYLTTYMNDTANWILVSGTFTSNGTEQWITIGGFSADAGSVTTSTVYSGSGVNSAYYYIDDVQVVPYPDSINVVATPSSICNGDTVRLISQTNVSNAYYFTWIGSPSAGAGFLNNNNDTVRAIPTDTILYTNVIHLPNYNGCTIHDTTTVNWKPGPANCSAGIDATVCLGHSLTLTGTLGTYGNYGTWQTIGSVVLCTNCTTTTITPTVSGDYVFVSAYSNSPTACRDRDTIHVTVTTLPVQIISSVGLATCDSNFIPFMTSPGNFNTWQWTTNAGSYNGVTNDTLMAMWNSNSTAGTVNVTVTDISGCQGNASITVPTCCTAGAEFVLTNTNTTSNTTNLPLTSGYYYAYNRSFTINGVFHVNANTRFHNCTVRFGSDAKIIVDPGFKFEIDKSNLYSCTDMWDGIYVDGTNSASEVVVIRAAVIEDAKNAIVSTNGGKFTIDGMLGNIKMNKNNIAVLVKPYQNAHPGTIKKAIISCDAPGQIGATIGITSSGANCRAPINGKAFAAIYIDSCSNITIGDSAQNSYRNLMERQKYGIWAKNSNVKVWNNDFKYYTQTFYQKKNSPIDGVAIYAKGNSSLTRTLTVGRVGGYKAHNLIRKCSFGVMAENAMNLNCEYNRFDTIYGIGVYSLNNLSKTILINKDSITEYTGTGISCLSIAGSSITITNNELNETTMPNPTSFGYTGIYVGNSTLNLTPTTILIKANTIKRVRNGIWVSQVAKAKILDNSITFYPNQPLSVLNPGIGIKLEGAHSALVRNNNISYNISGNPSSTLYDKLFGIHVTISQNDSINKNTIKKCGSGIFLKGTEFPLMLGCNTFNTCYYAVNFGYSNSVQTTVFTSDEFRWGNPTTGTPIPTGNTWTSTVSGQDLKGKISSTRNWWCNSFNVPTTGGMVAGSLSNGNTATTIGTADKCTVLLNPVAPISQTEMRNALLEGICKTPRTYDTLSQQYRYLDSMFAYRMIRDNPSWKSLGTGDDSYYNNFYNAVSSTNIGTLANVEDNIQQRTGLDAAATTLAGLIPHSTPEANRKAVLQIYLNTWAKDSMNLDSTQQAILLAIANQAPISGGSAVFDARNMLFLEVHDSSSLRIGHIHDEYIPTSHVYPNPSTGTLMLNYELPEGQSGNMELYDISGRMIHSYVLNSGTTIQQFDASGLPGGLYFCVVVVNNQAILTDKLILIK